MNYEPLLHYLPLNLRAVDLRGRVFSGDFEGSSASLANQRKERLNHFFLLINTDQSIRYGEPAFIVYQPSIRILLLLVSYSHCRQSAQNLLSIVTLRLAPYSQSRGFNKAIRC